MRAVSDHPGVERQVSTPSSHVVSLHLALSLSPEAVDALTFPSFTTKILCYTKTQRINLF